MGVDPISSFLIQEIRTREYVCPLCLRKYSMQGMKMQREYAMIGVRCINER